MYKNSLKKFWTEVSVQENDGFYTLLLDGKAVTTPSKKTLSLENKALIDKISDEWRNLNHDINPSLMPLSRLAMTYIDQFQDQPENLKAWLLQGLEYLSTDLLLFPSEQPKQLREKEDLLWLPLINKAQTLLNFNFKQNENLQPDDHNQRIGNSIFNDIYALNALAASVFPCIIRSTGSVILAFLTLKKQISFNDVVNACQIQENHQKNIWGDDPEQNAQLTMQSFEIKQFLSWVDCCLNAQKS